MPRVLHPVCPATSFPNARAPRGFIPMAAGVLALMLGFAGMTNLARADTPPTEGLWLSNSKWSVNLGSVLTYNSNTGTYDMPSPSGSAPAGWAWDQNPIGVIDNNTTNPSPSDIKSQSGALTLTKGDGTVITFFATNSTDPFLSYGFGVSNATGSTQTYTFTDGASISPTLSGNISLFADIGGSVTNTPLQDPATVTPVASDGFIQNLFLSSDGGTTFTSAGSGVGPAFTSALSPSTQLYGTYSSSLTEPAPFTVNYWQLQDQFTLTGNGDAAAFTGFAEITPSTSIIPEPSIYAALLGAFSLGVVVLRRNRKQ